MTGRHLDPLWRAPGGRTTPRVLAFAQKCGFRHVGWTAHGFLGDELSSKTHPNRRLLADSLRQIQDGEILLLHLGIWSRQDPYWPMLDPLLAGLKKRGFQFALLP
jgi:peptidoglycan/xylan/chitin deacetylase (PgdA/CDA1 family)